MIRKRGFGWLLAVFGLGYVAALLGQHWVDTPAHASDGGRKFDQWCTRPKVDGSEGLKNLNDDLKARGLEGYELVSTNVILGPGGTTMYYCVKRPL